MRILQVINSLDPAGGGPAEQTRQIALVLNNMSHHVEVLTMDPPNAKWLANTRFPVHALGPTTTRYHYSPALVPWLRAHIKDFDVCIVRGIWLYSSFGVWCALRKSGIPYFVYPHGMLDPWFKKADPFKDFWKKLYWPWAEYRVLRDAKAVIFTSQEECNLAKRSYKPFRCNELTLPYGISVKDKEHKNCSNVFTETFPHLKGKRIVLFLGRIHHKKGCDILIKAFSHVAGRYQDLRLVIAGPSSKELLNSLKDLAEESGISEKITWTGMISDDMKWGAYHSADIFILPSHQENFAIALAEALGCGVPALISNKVNTWRIVERYNAGLIESDDIDGTVRNLEKWLHMPSQTQSQMRKNAVSCFLENFEITHAAKTLINTLENKVVNRQSDAIKITIVQGPFFPVPPILGGAIEKEWYYLGKELASRGHIVTHISRAYETLASEEVVDGVRHVRIPSFAAGFHPYIQRLLDLIYSMRVLRVLPEADILISNSFSLPILVRNRKFGSLYVHIARYPKGQFKLYFNAARLQAVSMAVYKELIRQEPWSRGKAIVIPLFVKTDVQQGLNKPFSERKKHILFVGRIHPEKGVLLLINAFKKIVNEGLDGWRLIIIGPWRTHFGGGGQKYFHKLQEASEGIKDRISWEGPLFSDKVLEDYYRNASLFVYPSLAEKGESFGVAPLEAMSYGCPALVSSLECFKDFIDENKTGFVFNHRADDPVSELAKKIKELISSEERLSTVGAAAYNKAQEFGIKKVADLYIADFEKLLKEKKRNRDDTL